MDLDDLRIFRAVVREGGITRAAARLHRVQSNVTTRIRQLEAHLGVPLFVREGRRLSLAPAGAVLSDYAERLLELADQARAAVADAAPRGRLRLGSMESTAAARLPTRLAAFHQRYPDVQLELHTGATAPLLAQLRAGELDCVLVCGPVADARLCAEPAFMETLALIAPAGHPPITRARDVRPLTLLTFAPGCAYRHRLEQWLASDGVLPERVIELASYHAMLGCAAAGMGIALAPLSLLDGMAASHAVSVHPLPAEHAPAPTLLVRRAGVDSPTVMALREVMLAG
ncbi:LysR family transcriptional regulator [Rivihabitans pingtungensis]|uniref:LysR family transcriptional regulator n=1 Tax=Rivihabitans pingtungensis TaxID=1054498 RepID=UPI002FDB5605